MTYWLLCYKNNSSIIVGWIRGKDWLKYKNNVNNSTHYDLLTIVLQKNSLIIVDWIRGKMD